MNQEIKDAMRSILSMSGAIENITKAMKSAETSLVNGEAELIDLEKQLTLKKDELITLLNEI
jgi:mitochondrial fission protein ELM1